MAKCNQLTSLPFKWFSLSLIKSTALLSFSVLATLSLLLPLLATLVSFVILVLPTLIRFLLSRACFYPICDLHHIHPVLDFDTARITGTSFVHSRLDYYKSTYYWRHCS